jgi:hypothetical protein
MKQHRIYILAAGLLLGPTACGSDLTGLEDLDEFAGELAAHLEVAAVRCDDSRISTTGSTSCVAYGRDGQILENVGTPLVMWSTPDTAVARVDLSGRVVAVGVGMAQVIARGSRGSTASSDVVVE